MLSFLWCKCYFIYDANATLSRLLNATLSMVLNASSSVVQMLPNFGGECYIIYGAQCCLFNCATYYLIYGAKCNLILCANATLPEVLNATFSMVQTLLYL